MKYRFNFAFFFFLWHSEVLKEVTLIVGELRLDKKKRLEFPIRKTTSNICHNILNRMPRRCRSRSTRIRP
jgi:hypothetical protein